MAKKGKREFEEGEWWISNAVDRQVVRNSAGQNIIMEPGDVLYVLKSERSIQRVMKTQSHFMKYGGSLVGKYCIFPKEPDSAKLTQPAVFFESQQAILEYELNEDLFNSKTADELKPLLEAKAKTTQAA